MDVFLPLKKLLNQFNPLDRISDLENAALSSASADQLSEVSASTGDLVVDNLYVPAPEVEVTDPTDTAYTGHFISGAGYTFSSIVAQIGGVAHGVLQWGANTLGQLLVASGNMIMDYRGIYLNQAHVLAQLTANSNYPVTYIDDVYFGGFHVLGTSVAANGQMRFGHLSVMRYGSNVFTNGDFATGTTSSWTTTGSPTVVQDSPDGATYAASVDNSNYVSQAVTTVSGDDYVLTFYVRHVSGLDVGQIKIGANDINLLGADQTATNSWIKVVVLFRATAASTTIKAYSQLATGAVWYFTDFDCRRLDTWSYFGDFDSDHLGNLEIQSSRAVTIEAKNGSGAVTRVYVRNPVTFLQQATPTPKGAGYNDLYFKSDDKLYKQIASGTETAFAEGTGTASGTNTGDQIIIGLPGSQNLVGANNAGTPNTKYDFSADLVMLRKTSDNSMAVKTATGTITCDITLPASGSVSTANGCDSTKISSSASAWVYFYWIYNGTTIATIASLVAPPTGPTLPSGYTHWAFIGTVYLSAASQLANTTLRGNRITNLATSRPVNSGTATTETAVGLTAYVPAICHSFTLLMTGSFQNTSITSNNLNIRLVSGTTWEGLVLQAQVINQNVWMVASLTLPNLSQNFYYLWSANAGTRAAFLDIVDYIVPNGSN